MAEARLGTRDDAANPHIWTAEAVYELVRTWPREAWPFYDQPLGVRWQDKKFYLNAGLTRVAHPIHAAALFRDSGLRWLLRQGIPIITGQCRADLFWAATTKQGERWEGADLLLCISSAITRAKEGSNG